MKSNARMVALSVVLGACLAAKTSLAGGDSYEQQLKAAEASRQKDPAWKPACTEVATIQVGDGKSAAGMLKNFCLDAEGNVLKVQISQVTGTDE